MEINGITSSTLRPTFMMIGPATIEIANRGSRHILTSGELLSESVLKGDI